MNPLAERTCFSQAHEVGAHTFYTFELHSAAGCAPPWPARLTKRYSEFVALDASLRVGGSLTVAAGESGACARHRSSVLIVI